MNLNWTEIDEFCALLKGVEEVHRNGRPEWKPDEKSLYDDVAITYPPVERSDFIKYLPSAKKKKTNLADARKYLLLQPIDKGTKLQPVVSFSADLDCTKDNPVPKLGISVALGFRTGGTNISYLGYRFETPEGLPCTDADGNHARHSFFHAQFIQAFGRNGPRLNNPNTELGKVPEDQPSFLLSANDFVSFGLNVFISLYGGHFLKQALEHGFVSRVRLKQFCQLMAPASGSSLAAVRAKKAKK